MSEYQTNPYNYTRDLRCVGNEEEIFTYAETTLAEYTNITAWDELSGAEVALAMTNLRLVAGDDRVLWLLMTLDERTVRAVFIGEPWLSVGEVEARAKAALLGDGDPEVSDAKNEVLNTYPTGYGQKAGKLVRRALTRFPKLQRLGCGLITKHPVE